MDQKEFDEQFRILIEEYRSLNRQLENATDRDAVAKQMYDCVRRQNALREKFKQQGE